MTQSKKVLTSIVSEVSLRRLLLPPPPTPHQTTVRRESGLQLKEVSLSSPTPLPPPHSPTRGLRGDTADISHWFLCERLTSVQASQGWAIASDWEWHRTNSKHNNRSFYFFLDFQLWSYLWRGAKICWEVASSVQPSSDRKRSKAEGGNSVRKHQRSCQVCYFFCVNWGLFRGYDCLSF